MSDLVKLLESLSLDKEKVEARKDPKRMANLPGAMKAFSKVWPAQSTLTDHLRASQMYYTCPREFVLNYFAPKRNRSFDIKSTLMMSTGSHLHQILQENVLGPMGVLKGIWVKELKSRAEGEEWYVDGYHPDPERAIREAADQVPLTWRYEEYKVWDEKYRISGHVDGIISVERVEWLAANTDLLASDPHKAFKELQGISGEEESLLEIKTCGSYVYSKVNSPNDIPDYYKLQSNIYQQLTNVKSVIFWYLGRDDMGSKILPYWFEKNWWDVARNKAQVVWEAIRDLKLPEAMMACHTKNDTRAKGCMFREECWHKWAGDGFKVWAEACMKAQPERKWLNLEGRSFAP